MSWSSCLTIALTLTIFLLPAPTSGECVSSTDWRFANFIGCSKGRINYNNTVETSYVRSMMACASNCVGNQHCVSFTIQETSDTDYLLCKLSSSQITNCSLLPFETGARTYYVKVETNYCTNPWKLVLQTDSGSVTEGSIAALRDAVLRGAKVHVTTLPDPLDPSYFSGWSAALDTVKVSPGGDTVYGYSYTYMTSTYSFPVWTLLKFNSSGGFEIIMSNTSDHETTSRSIKWVVQEPYSPCYLSQKLSHGGPISVPALGLAGSKLTGLIADTTAALAAGSTAWAVSNLGGEGTLAYKLDTLDTFGSGQALQALATWIPADNGRHLPIRVQGLVTNRASPEMYMVFNTSSKVTHENLAVDPSLTRTDIYLDPCWQLKLSVDLTGVIVEGSVDDLVTGLRSGAAALAVLVTTTDTLVVEVETFITDFSGAFDVVVAYAKMGVTTDEGIHWVDVVANTDGTWFYGKEQETGDGVIKFYTDNRLRDYRYTNDKGEITDGDFEGVLYRLMSGLLPRVSMTLSSKTYFLDIESVDISSLEHMIVLKSYREAHPEGFVVYHITLDGYVRADVGFYRHHETNIIQEDTEIDVLTLFFEETI